MALKCTIILIAYSDAPALSRFAIPSSPRHQFPPLLRPYPGFPTRPALPAGPWSAGQQFQAGCLRPAAVRTRQTSKMDMTLGSRVDRQVGSTSRLRAGTHLPRGSSDRTVVRRKVRLHRKPRLVAALPRRRTVGLRTMASPGAPDGCAESGQRPRAVLDQPRWPVAVRALKVSEP